MLKYKKLIPVLGLIMLANAADAQQMVTRTARPMYGHPDIVAFQMQIPKSRAGQWYVGATINYSFLNVSSDLTLMDGPLTLDRYSDSFSMRPAFGFDVAGGLHVLDDLRLELRYWNSGKLAKTSDGMRLETRQQSLSLNMIYTFAEIRDVSFFGGMGVGVGMLNSEYIDIDTNTFESGTDKRSFGLAANAVVGIEMPMDNNWYLSLSYRLGYMAGHQKEIGLHASVPRGDVYIRDINNLWTHSIGLGIRHVF